MNVTSLSDQPRLRALVTGHRGFTGRYVVEALESRGYEVHGLSVDAADHTSSVVNLLDREAVASVVRTVEPDLVVHLAAISFVAHGDVDEMYRTNVVGTRNLLQELALLETAPTHTLLASSANVYGNSESEFLDEDVVTRPANDYAVSKLAMEYMAKLWMDRLPITIARPFNYTGVGQTENFLLPKIVSHFRRGERVIELGNIDVARDFQDVRFVADAYVRLLGMPAVGATVNLCSGVSVSLTEVIQIMERIAGYQIEIRVNPAFVRGNEVARLTGSNRKLSQLIGPLKVIPLEQTLRWMYEYDTPIA